MGDLGIETAVTELGEGRFRGVLHPDWTIWGPAGGYLASLALRAAGVASGRARPVSITGHFLGVAAFDEVELVTTVKRHTRVASSVQVDVVQGDRTVLTGVVWGADDLDGLTHHTTAPPPTDDPPAQFPTMAELRAAAGEDPTAMHAFWGNLDVRPVDWRGPWGTRSAGEPETTAWYRFVPASTFDDPWVDACRLLVLVDLDSWPAATRAHEGELAWYAPTVDVSCRFVDIRPEPWLLSRARAPIAHGGLVAHTAEVWWSDGRLAATGGSTLLCRPAERRPDT